MVNVVITKKERDALDDVFLSLKLYDDKKSNIFTKLLKKISNFFQL